MYWPYIFHKNFSKQITDLNGKYKIKKILEDYVSENLDDLGNGFYYNTKDDSPTENC